jgi:hypothetical protein
LSLFVDTDQFRLCETNKKHRERALSRRLLGSREDENSPFCLFLSLHLVLSMLFSETDTLRHFVTLLSVRRSKVQLQLQKKKDALKASSITILPREIVKVNRSCC